MTDVVGASVGGASLVPDSYTRIIDGGAVSSTSAIIPLVQQQEYMLLECVSSRMYSVNHLYGSIVIRVCVGYRLQKKKKFGCGI